MRRFAGVIVYLTLIVSVAWLLGFAIPDDMFSDSSGKKTADGQIITGPGFYFGAMITTDGSNACTVALYDGTDDTGNALTSDLVAPASTTNRVYASDGMPPVGVNDGIYADVTTSGTCQFVIYYRNQ